MLIALTYEGMAADPGSLPRAVQMLNDVSITMTAPPPNGSQFVGATTPLATKHYGGVALMPGAPFEDSMVITPPAAGEGFMVNFTVSTTQGGQEVTSYVTSVAP